jgi:hypothetical protein
MRLRVHILKMSPARAGLRSAISIQHGPGFGMTHVICLTRSSRTFAFPALRAGESPIPRAGRAIFKVTE